MDRLTGNFEGITEPMPNESEFQKLQPEFLDKWFTKEQLRAELDEIPRDREFRRKIAGTVILSGIGIEAILLLLSKIAGMVEAAGIWWAVVGPIIGYLICILYGPKK